MRSYSHYPPQDNQRTWTITLWRQWRQFSSLKKFVVTGVLLFGFLCFLIAWNTSVNSGPLPLGELTFHPRPGPVPKRVPLNEFNFSDIKVEHTKDEDDKPKPKGDIEDRAAEDDWVAWKLPEHTTTTKWTTTATAPPRSVDITQDVIIQGKTYPSAYSAALATASAGETNIYQTRVREAMGYAWNAYKAHAWGFDELRPISKTPSTWFDLGLTITDSLDTLWIMGLSKQFKEATAWVKTNLTITNNKKNVNLFETTIRVLGGLLSAFHLSKDEVFLSRAEELGSHLLPAFKSTSGIPYSDVNLASGIPKAPSWAPESSTSEVSTLQLEFSELTRLTKEPKFAAASDKVAELLHAADKPYPGLVPILINPITGKLKFSAAISLGARGDSYYEYLLKQYIQCDRCAEKQYLFDDFVIALRSIKKELVQHSLPNNYLYVGELLGGSRFSPKMDHLVCFLPGTIILAIQNGLDKAEFFPLAEGLMKTCIEMYKFTATGLAPEIVFFNRAAGDKNDFIIKPQDSHYLLRPETVESIFYFWRHTHDEVYRRAAWTIFLNIERYAKQPFDRGYSVLDSVLDRTVHFSRDKQESFFLAETLKYLYLMFGDDSTLPLNKWVFNTEAHPLPIW